MFAESATKLRVTADSQTIAQRLREYAKDWRTRAEDASLPLEAAEAIQRLLAASKANSIRASRTSSPKHMNRLRVEAPTSQRQASAFRL